jgi:hypothetical protein
MHGLIVINIRKKAMHYAHNLGEVHQSLSQHKVQKVFNVKGRRFRIYIVNGQSSLQFIFHTRGMFSVLPNMKENKKKSLEYTRLSVKQNPQLPHPRNNPK